MNLLVAFDLLMQEQNVSRAAERMFVSQSAMSHILQRLRQQLDDPLLVKTPSGMMPTDRALALIDPVAVVLRDVRRLINAREEFDPATSVRRFVIAATDYMDLLVIPALVERIVRYAPGVDFHVKQTETPFPVRELEYNDLDVVLGFETILKPPGHLVVEKLFDDRMTCLVSRNHPANKAELLTLDEYVSMKHMLISRSGTRIGLIDDWLAEKGTRAPHRPHRAALPLRAIHRRQDGHVAVLARTNRREIRWLGAPQRIACGLRFGHGVAPIA